MQEVLPILTLFLAPFSLSIPIKSFICPGFMFIQQALIINGQKQMSNLTEEREKIVKYLGKSCSKYYLIM